MSGGHDAAKLAVLSKTLPDQIQATTQAISLAERRLANVLTLRATGQVVKASAIAVARVALARALRGAEDLLRIHGVLLELLEQAHEPIEAK